MSKPNPIADADLLAFCEEEMRSNAYVAGLHSPESHAQIELLKKAAICSALRARLLALQRVEQLPAQWEARIGQSSRWHDAERATRHCQDDLSAALASPTRPEGRRDDR